MIINIFGVKMNTNNTLYIHIICDYMNIDYTYRNKGSLLSHTRESYIILYIYTQDFPKSKSLSELLIHDPRYVKLSTTIMYVFNLVQILTVFVCEEAKISVFFDFS